MGQVKGCHLVGSAPFPDAEAVFRECSAGMPHRLKRIPDGETGERHYFVYFQINFFKAVPQMIAEFADNASMGVREFTSEEVSDGVEKLKEAAPGTGYDEAAIASYEVFKKMREEGVIHKDTRFLVSIPTYINAMPLVEKAFTPAIAPIYEEALLRDMRNIQDQIPHEDLSIQIDLAVDTAYWENLKFWRPYFHNDDSEMDQRKQFMIDYTIRMLSQIDQDVEVGLHNCYGDMAHQHFVEPESLAAITERGLRIYERTPHPIQFFHLPVPRSAMDKLDSYYAPLVQLLPKFKEHNTELLLGLVHPNDLEGTKTRIEAAKKALGDIDFGISSECGWGRTPKDEIENIMKISSDLSEPVV